MVFNWSNNIIYNKKRRKQVDGKQICFYLIWYGVGRLFIESLRSDSLYIGIFKVSQIVSVLLILIGIIMYIILYFQNHKRIKNTAIATNNGRI